MESFKIHFRHCMLYEFHQEKNATQAAIAISSIYGENVFSVRTCQKWFTRFREGNFDLEDEQRPGRPQELETGGLQALLDEDQRQSTRERAAQMNVDHSTVLRRLHDMDKINKVGKWVPHKLSEININQRLSTCISLLARYKKKGFLWKNDTGHEKWIYYDNPVNIRQWLDPGQPSIATPKPNIHRKKVMQC